MKYRLKIVSGSLALVFMLLFGAVSFAKTMNRSTGSSPTMVTIGKDKDKNYRKHHRHHHRHYKRYWNRR
jgi:hypothetical protein